MEETIDLSEMLRILKKRIPLILAAMFICAAGGWFMTKKYMTPVYEASVQILITQQKSTKTPFDPQDIQLNLQLINTYNVILKSPAILSEVIKNQKLDISLKELQSDIRVYNEQNSQVVNISVQHESVQTAADIANGIVEVFQSEIKTLMNVDNVKVLSPAEVEKDASPVKPNLPLNTAIATIVGMMAGIGITLILEFSDTTIKSEKDIAELLPLTVLGVIGVIRERSVRVPQVERRRKRGVGSEP